MSPRSFPSKRLPSSRRRDSNLKGLPPGKMFVVQNQLRPSEIQNALVDLMRGGLSRVRVCSAYMSKAGSDILFDAIRRAAPGGDHERVGKIIVTSLDFGHTEPAALRFWNHTANSRVLVAGTSSIARGNLLPNAAFHPKFYVFDRPDGTVASLVGSANLTNRGLTTNSEVAWSSVEYKGIERINSAWDAAVDFAVPLTPEILDQYQALRGRTPRQQTPNEFQPVPPPSVGPPEEYRFFRDAVADPGAYDQFWVQSRGMQGGARTQLELPRGAHRFFRAAYDDYEFQRVEHIARPILVSGHRSWDDRPLTWHGDNAMERINLPSSAMGGFDYENALILFRRIAENTYELRVFPWDSDSARAYVDASRRAQLLFRLGQNSNRLAGFLP